MTKTTLVAGKDMPACTKFADSLAKSGRRVVACGDNETFKTDSDSETERQQKLVDMASGVTTVLWNRGSPISARTLILSAESLYANLDEVVFYFDEELYASKANQVDIQECSRGSSDMILSYQYLTLEALNRFKARKTEDNPGTLIYLLKEGPSAADAVRSPSLRNGAYSIASPVVAAAATAFMAFAENIAAIYGDLPNLNVLMVRGDKSMDTVANEGSLAKWLAYYTDTYFEQKMKKNIKASLNWVRPGTKLQGSGFSLFGKK
ncbi:MAG: hypothetical protein II563_04080 [Treponema sp.]|nr:hypothetical protein [Treponema sp.]MBQ2552012.1 hypothetical protein [Treponema sp.]MBQ4236860.1 hypothetical protein [Treponema sp.]MBQ5383465.1 hypothetical protein [Treponema sp.]